MKKLLKMTSVLAATALLFASCSASIPGEVVGKVNARDIFIPYFSEIFPAVEESTQNSTEENETSTTPNEETSTANETPTYDKSSAVIVSTMGAVFEETGNAKYDSRALNTAINNAKSQDGDDYLTKASETYGLPIRTEKDLINVLRFSLIYSTYLENMANITPEQIQESYADKYAVKYCASHILIENEDGANAILKKINSGETTFDALAEQAKVLSEEAAAAEATTTTNTTGKLQASNITLNDVKIKEFSDLDCQPASTYVAEFSEALQNMPENSVTPELVKTQFGYHIIQLTTIEKAELTKELEKEIRAALVQAKQQEPGFSAHAIKLLLDQVEVTFSNDKAKEQFEDYKTKVLEQAESFVPADAESSTANNEESSTNSN